MKSFGKRPVILLGVGNILMKDDGVGPRLLKYLRRAAGRLNVQCIDAGTPGPDMFIGLPGTAAIVVLDAVDFGGQPGEAVILDPADLSGLAVDRQWSAHQFGLLQALFTAGAAPIARDVKIIGVQPSEVGWGLELSAPVHNKIPMLAGLVLRYLDGHGAEECEGG